MPVLVLELLERHVDVFTAFGTEDVHFFSKVLSSRAAKCFYYSTTLLFICHLHIMHDGFYHDVPLSVLELSASGSIGDDASLASS